MGKQFNGKANGNGNVKGANMGRMVIDDERKVKRMERVERVERSKLEERELTTEFRSYAEFTKDDGNRGKSFQDCELTLIQRFNASEKELVSGAVIFKVMSGPKIRADVLCHHLLNSPDPVLEAAWEGSRNLKNSHINNGKKLKVVIEEADTFGSFKAILKEFIKTPFKMEEKTVGWIYVSSNGSISDFNIGLQCLNPLLMTIQEKLSKELKSKTDFTSIAYSGCEEIIDDDNDYLKAD